MTEVLTSGTRFRSALLFILGGALVLRLLLIPVTHSRGYTSDEREYLHLAAEVHEGKGFVDSNGDRAVRAPLFPLALSLLARWPWWIWLSHVIGAGLGVVVVYLGYLLAREMLPEEGGAVLAAALLAVHPGLAIYAGLLQTETLYTLLFLGLLLVAIRLPQDPRVYRGVQIGVLGGLAGLTRPVALGFFPLLLLAIFWAGRERGKQLFPALGVAAVCWCLTLAPWTVRNYALFDALVPVSSGGGGSLLLGNNPFATGGLRVGTGFDQWYGEQLRTNGGAGNNEVERSAVEGRIARTYMFSEPLRTIGLAFRKSFIYWIYPITHTDSDTRIQLPAVGADLLLMLGVAAGIVVLRAPRVSSVVVVTAILFFWLVQAVLHAESRFRLPVVPLLAVYWGAGVLVLRRPAEVRSPGRVAAMAATVLAVLVVYGVTAWMYLTGRL